MKQASVPLYIRFGEIPLDGKSKVYRGDEIVREEAGISVWRAVENCGYYYPILPEEPNENTISDYFDLLFHSDKKVYLVTGTEMFIEGADREPLLMDVKIIKEITYFRNLKEGEIRMKAEVSVEKLIKTFEDMANRESLLARGGITQQDLLMQIIGTIVHVAMEDEKCE